jgi:ribosomal protein L12E/L44/L45/RPP1/RPP2
LADYLDKNHHVAKDDSDLQDLCSKVQTAVAAPALPPAEEKAPPAPAQPPAAHEETKQSSVH